MSAPRIVSIGTANPDLYITQKDAYRFYEENNLLPESQRHLYARLLLEGPVKGRYFGLDDPSEVIDESPEAQIARFTRHARAIGTRACRAALQQAGLAPDRIGGLVVNTCTGYLCPGLTSYLAEDLGLDRDIKFIDIMGMGCGSAIPNLECGAGMLARTRGRPVLCLSVEICSATHMIDDDSGLTVSNCIFGDGAAAAVLSDLPENDGVELLDFSSGLFPKHREILRYRNHQGYLRNTLAWQVPKVGAECLEKVVLSLLERNGLQITDINWWAVHAGGTMVLRQVGKKLGLSADQLRVSEFVFEHFGNMSSPTVLFVMDQLTRRQEAAGRGLLLAFGAGFSAFAALANVPANGGCVS